MSNWTKVRSLFWQTPASEGPAGGELSDHEFAELLATEHAVPEAPVEGVDPAGIVISGAAGAVEIDFQAQYDAAGIPNTDEVEQLERFLGGLDQNLPHASRLTAAKAFLGAVGKSVQDVLRDAERKIGRVRAIRTGQEQATEAALAEEQARIQELTASIEEHRARMQEQSGALDAVRRACQLEEARLQAARVFFGNAPAPPAPNDNAR
jgi:hypothetical protein